VQTDQWDYIIVGAGSAGCVLANRLSANLAHRVLLLEAGGSHRNPLVTIPAGEAKIIGSKSFDWSFKAEPELNLGGRVDIWPRGKVLGGSSSINGMMWVRGQREDFDNWAQLGNTGWSYDDVLPFFKRSETSDVADEVHHGDDGPVTVSRISTPHPIAEAFIAGGVEVGLSYNPDFNGASQDGIGPIQANIRRGRRVSMAAAYLDPIRHRKNLTVLKKVVVDKVLTRNGRAIGVAYARDGGAPEQAFCAREVILSAGALASPIILMRSGIGPQDQLGNHGIAVHRHLPGVGRHLLEHAVAWSTVLVSLSTYNTELAAHKWAIHGVNWLMFGRGPASTPVAHAGAFIRTRPELSSPDVQICLIPTGYTYRDKKLVLLDRPAVTIGALKCRPDSQGSVELSSAHPSAPPRIFGNLLSDQADVQATVAGLRCIDRIVGSKAFTPFFKGRLAPGESMMSDADLEAYVRTATVPAYHPVGTCKMGNDHMAVVDHRLRVHGIEGLRVVDASIMPTMTSGNTNAPTVMIGERGADFILQSANQTRVVQ
jgi:choline dehydrogenase